MRIILLTTDNHFNKLFIKIIPKRIDELIVITEEKVHNAFILKKRLKKFGLVHVIDQIIFQLIFLPIVRLSSRKRIKFLTKQLEMDPFEGKVINHSIKSVNDTIVKEFIDRYKPDFVIVFGTRIIKSEIIELLQQKIYNIHFGITPMYRGVHGAYWALVNQDQENCGITLHEIDEGIDTGKVQFSKNVKVGRKDNFTTYPYLQLLSVRSLLELLISKTSSKSNIANGKGRLYYHPRFTEYIRNYFKIGIK